MKRLVAIIAIIAAPHFALMAEVPSGTNIMATTLFEDGRTNTWTAADLQSALGLLNRKYHRDMLSIEGRRRWHGQPKHSVSTNATTRIIEAVETYPDGFVYANPGKRRKLLSPEEESALYLARRERRRAGNTATIELLRARIAALETQRSNGTNELEMAHAIIELAATRKRLARLEATQTNTVTIIATP